MADDPILVGSSPRARGARPRPGRIQIRAGIIPACAGSTPRPRLRRLWSRDHPRVRGEHSRPGCRARAVQGSSPRARGALETASEKDGVVGIIPACAGSTCTSSTPSPASRDHPRVRGEHYKRLCAELCREGSSPRARGAREPGVSRLLTLRIIPACAGSTLDVVCGDVTGGDHPRVRGEHASAARRVCRTLGSSPRARGAHGGDALDPLSSGDHPRVRGEHGCRQDLGGGTGGSSPRARGAPDDRSATAPQPGSSPRARGALNEEDVLRRQRGIIPACAGSTRPSARRTT